MVCCCFSQLLIETAASRIRVFQHVIPKRFSVPELWSRIPSNAMELWYLRSRSREIRDREPGILHLVEIVGDTECRERIVWKEVTCWNDWRDSRILYASRWKEYPCFGKCSIANGIDQRALCIGLSDIELYEQRYPQMRLEAIVHSNRRCTYICTEFIFGLHRLSKDTFSFITNFGCEKVKMSSCVPSKCVTQDSSQLLIFSLVIKRIEQLLKIVMHGWT